MAVTPDRMQLERIKAMAGSKRAGGSDRMEQRASGHSHGGMGSWWQFSFWQKIVYNSCILRVLHNSLLTLHNYPLLNLAELIEFIFFLSQKARFLFLKPWNILFADGHQPYLYEFIHIENRVWPIAEQAKDVHWGGSALLLGLIPSGFSSSTVILPFKSQILMLVPMTAQSQ